MTNQLLRPIGFRPWEISGIVNRRVVQIHVSETAFLWMQRNRAVKGPHFRLKHLDRLDRRVEGHLEGLRVAGSVAWSEVQRALGNADAGTVFAAAYVAFAGGDADKMRIAVQLGFSSPAFQDALVAALAWSDVEPLRGVLDRLQQSSLPAHRRLVLSVLSAHRIDSGTLIAASAESDDVSLRGRAMRAIGEMKRRDLLALAQRAEQDENVACRFWAGASVAIMGNPKGAQVAFEAGREDPTLLQWAIEIAMRCGDPAWARNVVRSLAEEPTMWRRAIQAAGGFGDPASIPWLLGHMNEPAMARLAGEAFSMITGADLDYLGLKEDAPEDFIDEPNEEDADLPWPRIEGVSKWWKSECGRFTFGQRYLAGRPVSMASAIEVLREGYQRQRFGAALELARLNERALVFPVAGRANWQKQRLAT